MRFREIVFAACAAMPALAWAQGVIPTNNAAIFSAQPVQTPSGTTTGTLATRWGDRLDLVADFGADPTGNTDISTALNAAIATGKPIFIPAGTYLFSGSVTDAGAEPVNITCSGQATTTINMSGSIAISQTGAFTIPVSIVECGFDFSGSASISLTGTAFGGPAGGPYFYQDNFYVTPNYTGPGPVLNFSTVTGGSLISTYAYIDISGSGVLNTFAEISGEAVNWTIEGSQWIDVINPSNTANQSTGLYLNGSSTVGVQGTRISNSNIMGFNKNVFIGPYNDTTQISNSMLDQGYYALYIDGAGINDVRVDNTYMASSAAASSGAAAVYVGAADNVKISHNVAVPYNTGNYPIDLTNASSGQVTLLDNLTNGQAINNPNNIPLGTIITQSPIAAPNTLNNQIVLSSDTTLTASQAGNYIFWTGGAGTITVPNSTAFNSGNGVGGGVFYIQNSGSAPVNIVTDPTDHNYLPGASSGLGGSAPLPPGAAYTVYANPDSPGWAALNYNSTNLIIPSSETINGALTAGSATINGIAVGVTPSVATLGTNPPVSGTAYQWAGPGTLQLACPITYSPTSTAAATSTLDIGSTSTPSSAVDTESEPAAITAGMVHTSHAEVPAGWYYELTATNATIGTCVGIVH